MGLEGLVRLVTRLRAELESGGIVAGPARARVDEGAVCSLGRGRVPGTVLICLGTGRSDFVGARCLF